MSDWQENGDWESLRARCPLNEIPQGIYLDAASVAFSGGIGALVGSLLDAGKTPEEIGDLFQRYAAFHAEAMQGQIGQRIRDTFEGG